MSSIITLNIGGLLSHVTQTSFLRYLRDNEVNIALVQETNQREGEILDVIENNGRYNVLKSPGFRRGSGILIMMQNSFSISDVVFSIINNMQAMQQP